MTTNYAPAVLLLLLALLAYPDQQVHTQTNDSFPNVLLIIADDLGVDVSNGYHQGAVMPTTPNLDNLRASGITFENVWASPKCTPTRANIMSGKYGVKTGVLGTPGNLDTSNISVFRELENQIEQPYADAVIGKWHISQPVDAFHAIQHGADYFMGAMGAAVEDYYAWSRTENGISTTETNYATREFTDASISWINTQTQPWLLWLAHVAPHGPFHVPPSEMFTIVGTSSNFRKYLAMIESVDYEIGRLLDAMPDDVRDNTLIIYVGDNGTPGNFTQDYPAGHGKSTLYQGGIRVPMIIAGAGVDRIGERESALIHVSDLYATILEVTGAELPGGLYNSLSFSHLLTNDPGPRRDYNYAELADPDFGGWTIRNTQYKLIEFDDNSQEMYDLVNDSLEFNNLMTQDLSEELQAVKADLETEAAQIRTAWSCRDFIQNGNEEGIDCGGSFCTPCSPNSAEEVNVPTRLKVFPNPGSGNFNIRSENDLIEEVRIYDVMGRLLWQQKDINSFDHQLDLHTASTQVFIAHVKHGGRTEIIRLIKK